MGFRQDPAPVYRSMDILVQASVEEGFGLPVLEAMACGLPVVSTRSGGPEELIVDGDTGLLVPVDDVDAITAAVRTLLTSRDYRLQLGENARQSVGGMTWDRLVQSYLEYFAEIIASA